NSSTLPAPALPVPAGPGRALIPKTAAATDELLEHGRGLVARTSLGSQALQPSDHRAAALLVDPRERAAGQGREPAPDSCAAVGVRSRAEVPVGVAPRALGGEHVEAAPRDSLGIDLARLDAEQLVDRVIVLVVDPRAVLVAITAALVLATM